MVKLGTDKTILHNMPYEAISVTVDKTTAATVEENGRKVLKAGTIVYGDGGSIFKDRSRKVKQATGNDVDGITLNDIDVTEKDAEVAMVYRGTVRSDRVKDLSEEQKEKFSHIQFVEGV